jgi:hypothetical protein
MEDARIMNRIENLVDEEHRLYEKGEEGGLSDDEHERLRSLQVGLDQCWDLLRQRRARRDAGLDPNQASVRGPGTVEGYEG